VNNVCGTDRQVVGWLPDGLRTDQGAVPADFNFSRLHSGGQTSMPMQKVATGDRAVLGASNGISAGVCGDGERDGKRPA